MAAGVKISKISTFDFNPRGNLWFNDESTFGHKLLSKMGWSKGKGLGKNEDGIKENIKMSKKDSLTGIGYKSDIPIAEGCVEYENILSQLQRSFKGKEIKSAKNVNSTDLESLEQRSRNTRNRLHYQKYVRGKDLFRYSEKDMKCIFLEKPQESVIEKINEQKKSPTFKSQLSVQDYFSMKMQKKNCVNTEKDSIPEPEDITLEEIHLSHPIADKKRKNTFGDLNKTKRTKTKHEKHTGESPANSDTTAQMGSSLSENSKEIPCSEDSKTLIKNRKKSKKNKLKCLKSCLTKSLSYNLEKSKKVTFNEEVSFKLLDTSLELCAPIKDSTVEDDSSPEVTDDLLSTSFMSCDSEEETASSRVIPESDPGSSSPIETETKNCKEDVFDVSDATPTEAGESERLENPLPKCYDLPKNSSSNYNFWLENQRQALKMKLYKTMINKIKKHKILGTSNLLDIKGYGNWGI